MKTEHKYAQVLRWIADGESIQTQGSNGSWINSTLRAVFLDIDEGLHIDRFRLKPRTITVNGRDIVAGETSPPYDGYFAVELGNDELFFQKDWRADVIDLRFLQRGLVHLTKENAIAHAKAMLGID